MPKPKPKSTSANLPISPAFWDALPGKGKWDIQVALRGPDVYNPDLIKWFTTSIIRYAVSSVMRVGGMINSSHAFLLLPSKDDGGGPLIGKGDFHWYHFLDHVHEAAAWLAIPIIWVPSDKWWACMGDSNFIRGLGKAILLLQSMSLTTEAEILEAQLYKRWSVSMELLKEKYGPTLSSEPPPLSGTGAMGATKKAKGEGGVAEGATPTTSDVSFLSTPPTPLSGDSTDVL